ncbi:MAG: oxidoreductase [Candidatus Heimdallarchaeaceae archaeon]
MKILEPFYLKHIALKNRMIMAGMDTNFGDEEGNILDKLIQYYEQRARGAIGLIIVEGAYFDKRGAGTATMLSIDSNRRIKRFKELVHAIKKHGSHALIQIYHAGAQASSFMIGLQAVAPSAVPFEMSGEVPIPLTKKQITKIVKEYGKACLRAKKAGFDGVEIHAGHVYLLNQFFSLRTNKREDEYGCQSFENRTRAAVEIIREVRKKCGEEFIIGFRINGSDYIPEGLEIEDVVKIAQILDKEGVDLFNITGGVFDSPGFPVVPYMNYSRGCFVDNAAKVKAVVKNAKISVVGRLNTPISAEKVLQENKADLVTIGRALLADSEFPNKVKEGETDSIRLCIGCNACLNQIMTEQPVACSINANLLSLDSELSPTTNRKNVMIIGAGPAGLEAARVADIRGHNVLLVEKKERIGGSLQYAKSAPMKREVENLIDFYERAIDKSNIELKLNREFSNDLFVQFQPDIVIIATGIEPAVPSIEGLPLNEVYSYTTILSGRIPEGSHIVVIGGDMIGLEVTDFLVNKGKEVTILTTKKRLGTDLYSLVAREVVPLIEKKSKVSIITQVEVIKAEQKQLLLKTSEGTTSLCFDSIVFTSANPNNKIEDEIKKLTKSVYNIGDCKEQSPRKIMDAIREGYNIGLNLEKEEMLELFALLDEGNEEDKKKLLKNKIRKRSFTNEDIPLYLEVMVEICNNNEKLKKKNKKSNLGFQVKISENKNYFIRIENGRFCAEEGILDKPDITIKMDKTIAAGIFSGTINASSAYLNKELEFEGSMMLGLKFRSITEAVRKELDSL